MILSYCRNKLYLCKLLQIFIQCQDSIMTSIMVMNESTCNIKSNFRIDSQINASLVKSIICKNIEKCQKNMNEIQIYEALS